MGPGKTISVTSVFAEKNTQKNNSAKPFCSRSYFPSPSVVWKEYSILVLKVQFHVDLGSKLEHFSFHRAFKVAGEDSRSLTAETS